MKVEFLRGLLLLLAVALAAGVWACTQRYEVSHGGSDRYYVVVKLDRWTGRTWQLTKGQNWTEITPGWEAPR